MITKNWYAQFAKAFFGAGGYMQKYDGKAQQLASASLNTSNYYKLGPANTNEISTVYPTVYNAAAMVFGNGTTHPTVDDYCLSGDIITTLQSITHGVDLVSGDTCSVTHIFTLKNTGSEPVCISEVGWCVGLGAGSTLCDRTLLDEPVTIASGETGVINYTISVALPVDVTVYPIP